MSANPAQTQTPQRVAGWAPLWRGASKRPWALFVVSVGGAGLVPLAPGTVGTLCAWGAVAAAPHWPAWVWLAAAAVTVLVGWGATAVAQSVSGDHDPGWIVVDEVAAFWLLYGLSGGGFAAQAAQFLLFRLFDIAKPWPANRLDERSDRPLFVMLDDVVAAVYAAAAWWALRVLWPALA